jgi:hypothetical protein
MTVFCFESRAFLCPGRWPADIASWLLPTVDGQARVSKLRRYTIYRAGESVYWTGGCWVDTLKTHFLLQIGVHYVY